MKILCLLAILANIFLFFWEYRSGAFATKKNEEHALIQGREPIVLVRELKTPLPTKPDTSSKPKPLDPAKPASGIIELQQKIENPALAPSIQATEQPKPHQPAQKP